MKLIIKRYKKHTKSSVKKVKRAITRHTTKNMKRKSKKSSHRSSGGKLKIPVIGKFLNNPTVSKVTKAAGTVALVGAAVNLLNQPQVSSIWSNQLVRSAVAYSSGDFIGAAGTYVLENPQLVGSIRGGSSQQSSSSVGFA